MIRGVAYSRRLLVAALTAAGTAVALAALHLQLAAQTAERRLGGAALEAALAEKVAKMSDCRDADLLALRARVAEFRGRLGPRDTWERLVRLFGSRWVPEPGIKADGAGYSVQPGAFLLSAPVPSDWPAIVELVGGAAQVPGVSVAGIEIRSGGDKERRSLDQVRIAVAIHTRLFVKHQ